MHAAHMGKDAHHDGVDSRGDHVMGFDHSKTTHHFRLLADGGAIEADAVDATDVASRDAIRKHFAEIARAFAEGDFSSPMAIHERVPPGVPEMQRLKSALVYTVEETERGGRVRISTTDPEALAAVHAFLRFQIDDHRTGDSGTVEQ